MDGKNINNMHDMLPKDTFEIKDQLLGKGAYGNVFLAIDSKGKEVAVKCCSIKDKGIPNIMEAVIMSSIYHTNINNSICIKSSDTDLFIIQELAKCDLSKHTKRDKGNYKPNLDQLKLWCYSLVQAISALHSQHIIHADVKASNVLLYNDDTIKLTDFTLSVKKLNVTDTYKHTVCTCTHRPLECLMKKPWDESLDIWSLGCTFYEIAYGELLFHHQKDSYDGNRNSKELKRKTKEKLINAIIDWSSTGPGQNTSYDIIGITKFQTQYTPYKLVEDFHNPEMKVFNDLLCKMLNVDPKTRINISEILEHPFFKGLTPVKYLSIGRSPVKIPTDERLRVVHYIQRYNSNKHIQNLSFNIYIRCNNLDHINEHIRVASCIWIASKIVLGNAPDKLAGFPINKIIEVEREICHNLSFRLNY
jgi:serine/threonine protein kinase